MEDHYVRAHGPEGSALILMRMRDAVAELDGMAGLQVHRSWWVAREAVERVEKEGDRVRLRLVNGMTVPVARSQIGAVRAQRWPAA
jgi:DNA-binding LytR/AlgR family response regulator